MVGPDSAMERSVGPTGRTYRLARLARRLPPRSLKTFAVFASAILVLTVFSHLVGPPTATAAGDSGSPFEEQGRRLTLAPVADDINRGMMQAGQSLADGFIQLGEKVNGGAIILESWAVIPATLHLARAVEIGGAWAIGLAAFGWLLVAVALLADAVLTTYPSRTAALATAFIAAIAIGLAVEGMSEALKLPLSLKLAMGLIHLILFAFAFATFAAAIAHMTG